MSFNERPVTLLMSSIHWIQDFPFFLAPAVIILKIDNQKASERNKKGQNCTKEKLTS